jgi:hypothetical protein
MENCQYCDIKICCNHCSFKTGNNEFIIFCEIRQSEGFICCDCEEFIKKEEENENEETL